MLEMHQFVGSLEGLQNTLHVMHDAYSSYGIFLVRRKLLLFALTVTTDASKGFSENTPFYM